MKMKYSVLSLFFLVGSMYAHSERGFGSAIETEGYLRLGVQRDHGKESATDTALGGLLKGSADLREGVSVAAGFYFTYGIGKKENIGIPFYDNDNQNLFSFRRTLSSGKI